MFHGGMLITKNSPQKKIISMGNHVAEGVKFAHCVIQRGTSKDSLISAYPFVDRYLYLTKRLHLVDIPYNVIKMEIVSSPRGKVRRCFRGVFMTALFLNNNGTGFFLFIHFF